MPFLYFNMRLFGDLSCWLWFISFLDCSLVVEVLVTTALKGGGFGWCIRGMDDTIVSQCYTLAAKKFMLQEALQSAKSAGLSSFQVLPDSIILVFCISLRAKTLCLRNLAISSLCLLSLIHTQFHI